jgi:hypothetical protein
MTDSPRSVALCLVLILCFASVALADDFKTINGKEYKNATVKRVEPDGIVLTNSSGISKVYFAELPKEVQQRFHYDAAQAAQFTAATQAVIANSNGAEAARQQAIAAERQEIAAEKPRKSFRQSNKNKLPSNNVNNAWQTSSRRGSPHKNRWAKQRAKQARPIILPGQQPGVDPQLEELK